MAYFYLNFFSFFLRLASIKMGRSLNLIYIICLEENKLNFTFHNCWCYYRNFLAFNLVKISKNSLRLCLFELPASNFELTIALYWFNYGTDRILFDNRLFFVWIDPENDIIPFTIQAHY